MTSRNHHGSHEHLIAVDPGDDDVAARRVDAIIVPTSRPAPAVERSVWLAVELRCPLVVLSSQWSRVTEVVKVARPYGAEVVVVDVTNLPATVLPRFATCDLLTRTRFHRPTDTSHKRNLGLLLARLCGWKRVVFLDDDIAIASTKDLRKAAGLTDRYAGVGLFIDGFPDNSVVCHAYREAGGTQGTFIGGGALAVGERSMSSFFPNIYNEDWFFLLGEDSLQPVTRRGRVKQEVFDPFADRRRASSEEFGDCLAEGLFWLLDQGHSLQAADSGFWREFLDRRLRFIADVIAMVLRAEDSQYNELKVLASLQAARDRCRRITPGLCVDYVAAWREDRMRWRRHLELMGDRHGTAGVEKVLSALGLAGQSRYLPRQDKPLTMIRHSSGARTPEPSAGARHTTGGNGHSRKPSRR